MTGPGTADPLGRLKADMDEAVQYAQGRTKVWSLLYYATRSALIVFSVLTSAQAITAFGGMDRLQAAFALAVTILAGFDSWLKPGDKYRAAYTAVDDFNQIRQKTEFIDPTDKARIAELLTEYEVLNGKLRAALFP
jgi:hypothetical protein